MFPSNLYICHLNSNSHQAETPPNHVRDTKEIESGRGWLGKEQYFESRESRSDRGLGTLWGSLICKTHLLSSCCVPAITEDTKYTTEMKQMWSLASWSL